MPTPELAPLSLVQSAQQRLAETLDSLVSALPPSPQDRYIGYCGKTINRAAEAYCLLRSHQRHAASKLLVRPIIETGLRARFVFEDSAALVPTLNAEFEQDKKRCRNLAEVCPEAAAELAAEIATTQRFQAQFIAELETKLGCQQNSKHEPAVAQIAQEVRMAAIYPFYRLYCQYTHGAYRAATDELDEYTDPVDNFLVALFTVNAAGWIASRNGLPIEALRQIARQLDDLWVSTGGTLESALPPKP